MSTPRLGDLFPTWIESYTAPLTSLRGQDYILVKHRLIWFHSVQRRLQHEGLATHPVIVLTECLEHDRAEGYARYTTFIQDCLGNQFRMEGSETKKDFVDYAEKASTKSLGRALAAAGYGTDSADAFGNELEDGAQPRPVDTPTERKRTAKTTVKAEAPTPPAPPALPAPKPAGLPQDLKDRLTAKFNGEPEAGTWMIQQFYPQYNANYRFGVNATEADALSFLEHYDERFERYIDQRNAEEDAEVESAPDVPAVQSSDLSEVVEETAGEGVEETHEMVYERYKAKVQGIQAATGMDPKHTNALSRIIASNIKTWENVPGKKVQDTFSVEELRAAMALLGQYDPKLSPEENVLALAPNEVKQVA